MGKSNVDQSDFEAALIERGHKRVSDAVAYGLLVYTALQIFMTMHAIKAEEDTMLPMLGLVVLVAAIIPLYRHMERRWDRLAAALVGDDEAFSAALRRTQMLVWGLSVGLPLLVTGLLKALAALL